MDSYSYAPLFTPGYFTGYTPSPCCGTKNAGWPARFETAAEAATSALATDNLGQGVLVQRFDSAKHTPGQGPLYSVYPMSPSLISVNTGVLYGAAPTQAEVAAGAAAARSLGLSTTAAPRGLNVNSCGYKCNGPSASPLPPSGFTAWSSMIYRANAGNSALWGSNF